ncbi:MAG TPA: ComF family protein [Dehalococcoidia bacterium]|nr:ComF family protein [Dehalococcoidia bacterium]
MATLSLGSIGRAALDLLYPPRCAICGSGGDFLCATCFDGLPLADGPRCDVCWLPVWSAYCRACETNEPAFSALRSAFRYTGEVRTLVHAFKYGGQSSLAPSLAAPMLDACVTGGLRADVVVPVPVTGLRRRTRGYNQAGLLAAELARALDLPATEALRRRGFAGQQARSASAEERRRNVAGVFAVAKPEAIEDRRVLLVDDIATTCATLDACAQRLLDAGARDVVALTLARED